MLYSRRSCFCRTLDEINALVGPFELTGMFWCSLKAFPCWNYTQGKQCRLPGFERYKFADRQTNKLTSMQKKNCRKPTRFAQPRPGSHSHGPRNQWRPLTFISFDRRFLISLSNLTFQHWFSILPGNSKHQKRLSIIHHPLSTFHHPTCSST